MVESNLERNNYFLTSLVFIQIIYKSRLPSDPNEACKRESTIHARAANFWSNPSRSIFFSFSFLFFPIPISFSPFYTNIGKEEDSLRHADDVGCCKGGRPAGPRGLLARRRRICSFGIRALSVLLLIHRLHRIIQRCFTIFSLIPQPLFFFSTTLNRSSLHTSFLSLPFSRLAYLLKVLKSLAPRKFQFSL